MVADERLLDAPQPLAAVQVAPVHQAPQRGAQRRQREHGADAGGAQHGRQQVAKAREQGRIVHADGGRALDAHLLQQQLLHFVLQQAVARGVQEAQRSAEHRAQASDGGAARQVRRHAALRRSLLTHGFRQRLSLRGTGAGAQHGLRPVAVAAGGGHQGVAGGGGIQRLRLEAAAGCERQFRSLRVRLHLRFRGLLLLLRRIPRAGVDADGRGHGWVRGNVGR